MAWQWTPYTIPLIIVAIISAIAAFYISSRRHHVPGSQTGVLILLATAEWTIGYSLELASTSLSDMVFWDKAQFVGICIIPTAWLVYVLQYTGREKWLTRRTLALLSIVPVITLLLAFTNEAHDLIWARVWLDTDGLFPVKGSTFGVGLWIYMAYSYIVVLVGIFLLIQALVRSGRLYRWQASALLFAVFTALLSSVVTDIFGLGPFPCLDLTPLALCLTVPVIAWILYRLRRLDIVPVARGAVIEGMGDGILVLDAQNRVVDLNPAAQHLFGYTFSEAVGQSVEQVWPEWPDQFERPHDGTEAGKEVMLGEGDGQRTYDVSISRLADWRGRLTSQVIVLRDITGRKRAEEEIRGLAKFPSEDPNPVLRIAQDGAILYANKASLPLLNAWGCQEDQPLPDDWHKFTLDVLGSGTSEGAEVEIDDCVLSLTFAPVVDAGYVNVYGLDITERKRAEAVLKEYSERLEEMVEERTRELQDAHEQLIRREKLAVLGQMAASVSHELRNPLGTISNAAYYLKMVHTDADETTKEYLDIITQEVRNSDRIISDLLDFSRTRLPDREKVAVSDLVTQVLEKQPPPKNVTLTTHIALDLPLVYVDRHQMGQVLANLVTNAYQSMPEGGNLTISAQAQEEAVALSIADTGVGISEENIAKLFEPLFTTKTKGLGLGLMVVKMLVEANEGSIEVKSEVGKGSTFVVILPTSEEVS